MSLIIELTPKEAEVLMGCLDLIGGEPSGPRGYLNSIQNNIQYAASLSNYFVKSADVELTSNRYIRWKKPT